MADIKLTAQDATKKIRDIVRNGYVVILPHCREQMARRGYIDVDIDSLLRHGHIKDDPEFNNEHQQWRYRVEGVIEGDQTVLIVAFPSDVKLFCITIFSII